MTDDHAVKILNRDHAQHDTGHRLQIVERDRLTFMRTLQAEMSTLVGARYTVEHRGDVPRIWVCVLDRTRQKRSCKRPLLHVRALSEPCQTRCMLGVKRDVQSMRERWHELTCYTVSHKSCSSCTNP